MNITANTTNFRQSLGKMGELLAQNYLVERGWQLLQCNYYVHRRGEIDIIGRPAGSNVLAFVEVKTRDIKPYNAGLDHPGQLAVNRAKVARLQKAAMTYISINPAGGAILRFDLLLVDVQLERQILNEIIRLKDLAALATRANISHLEGIAGTF